MKLELNIEKISLISGATSGSDLMFIYLKDKIEGIYPFKNNLALKVELANNMGLEYIKKNFPEISKIEYLNLKGKNPQWKNLNLKEM